MNEIFNVLAIRNYETERWQMNKKDKKNILILTLEGSLASIRSG